MNSFLSKVAVVAAAFVLISCGPSPREQFDAAMAEGRLTDAQNVLPQIDKDDGFYICCETLIEEYLAVDNIDKAIYVFDKISIHYSMNDPKYRYETSEFSERMSKLLYTKLIEADRFDDAWAYHPLSYDGEDYPGNAPDYFSYMSDVIIHLCATGRSSQATQFIKQKGFWFLKNVDNHEWGKDYPNYRYDIMRSELNKVYNSAQ